MSVSYLGGEYHHCDLGDATDGTIARCDVCGAYWRRNAPPSRDFRTWRWTRISKTGARLSLWRARRRWGK